jgi:hypothetical protein
MSPASQVPFPSRDILLAGVKQVLATYAGTAVTVRQLYYRLVAAAVIPNNLRAYKNLVAALSTWRRSREIPLAAFEDRTRAMAHYDEGWRHHDPKLWVRRHFEAIMHGARDYKLAKWYGQDKRVIVAVEKQALQGPFAEVCEEMGVDLAVCRGYPSLSFLRDIAQSMKDRSVTNEREIVVLYFGDFDPSGLNIPEVVDRDLGPAFFHQSFDFDRKALTKEQIEEMDLIPAPVKLTDSRAEGFMAEHGEEVYELDAIEPARLQEIIRESIREHWDEDAESRRDDDEDDGRDEVARLLDDKSLTDFLTRLGES